MSVQFRREDARAAYDQLPEYLTMSQYFKTWGSVRMALVKKRQGLQFEWVAPNPEQPVIWTNISPQPYYQETDDRKGLQRQLIGKSVEHLYRAVNQFIEQLIQESADKAQSKDRVVKKGDKSNANVSRVNIKGGNEMNNKENNIEVINLTPHAINIIGGPTFEPSGEVARISSTNKSAGEFLVNGEVIPLITQEFGEVVGLPEEKEGTLFIVSSLIFANSDRKDLLVPGEQVRDDQGRVIGCKSFQVREGIEEVSKEENVKSHTFNNQQGSRDRQVREGIEEVSKEENVKSYTFNNQQGSRDRQVAAAIWHEGQTYTLDEAKEAKLASVVVLDREKAGKWSNETMRVVVKSATLVVFREPFEGWSEDKGTALEQAKESAQEYLSEDISSDVLWDVLQKFFPRKAGNMKTAEEQGWTLM